MGDLKFAERLWTEMVEKGEHINLLSIPINRMMHPPAIQTCLPCWIRTCSVPITSAMNKSVRGSQKNASLRVNLSSMTDNTSPFPSIAGGCIRTMRTASILKSWRVSMLRVISLSAQARIPALSLSVTAGFR